MKRALNIVYATDNGYLVPTMVAMASAVKHAHCAHGLIFHILDTGISEEGWERFIAQVRTLSDLGAQILRHRVDMSVYMGMKPWHGSWGTYARLEIPKILADVDWCVYADGDTLFVADPWKLEQIFDKSYAIQGHKDWLLAENGASVQQKWFEQNGLPWDGASYFCAGFVLMNLKWFREHNASDACLKFLMKYPTVNFPDQDALAYVCQGKIGLLPDEWGRFSWDAFRTSERGCLHFASDLPSKLMTNRYLDYNDAHKLWFNCAKEMLGLRMGDVLTPPLRPLIALRKLFFRWVFVALRKLVGFGLVQNEALKEYCLRHYDGLQ